MPGRPTAAQLPPQTHDPFRRSLLARAAWIRLLAATAILCLFWLAVAWAVSVP